MEHLSHSFFTVWRFESPITGDSNIVARNAEPNDRHLQHEYQRILWQGLANSKEHAKILAAIK